MHIPLLEMAAEDAAEHATKVFLDVSILTCRILTLLSTDHRILSDCVAGSVEEMPNLSSSK
jgi:hypothetical protein